MPLQYETLYDASNGQKLQLTVNSNIQRYLEDALRQAYIDNKCAYANGIVMDVNTGAILGMATMGDYDPNRRKRRVRKRTEQTQSSMFSITMSETRMSAAPMSPARFSRR